MQMLLESRVDRLEVLMSEVLELCRDLKIEAAERDRQYKEDQAQRDRRQEERDRKEKEARKEEELKEKEARKEEDRKRHKEYLALTRDLNKRLGEISNKAGTLVEDIIAPGAIPLIERYFKCRPYYSGQRIKREKGDLNCEVDLLLMCKDKAFMIETKSHPDSRDVTEILTKTKTLANFFPDCTGKQIIPMLASIVVDKSVVNYANKQGLYVVAYRQWEYLDILNFAKINTRRDNSPLP
ncbi:MAG: hypothetical protein HQL02_07515 [Nitrospirae bacterium]|nr:hypothetical protein [Nitrospirota bacterium]